MKRTQHRKWIIWTAVVLALILVLIIVPIQAGKWYWKQVREELRAKGEKLFAPEFQKSPIAAADNYFAIPYFDDAIKQKPATDADKLKEAFNAAIKERKILSNAQSGDDFKVGNPISFAKLARNLSPDATEEDKRAEALAWLRKHLDPLESIRSEILKESQRPYSDVSLNLEDGLLADLKFTSPAINLVKFCQLHAVAALERGDTATAMEDIAIIHRSVQALAAEPVMICRMIAMAGSQRAESIICDGMQLWSEDQLQKLDAMIATLPMEPKSAVSALRMERAMFNTMLANIRRTGNGIPGLESGFLVNNYAYIPQANYNLTLQTLIEMVENGSAAPPDFQAIDLEFTSLANLGMWPHVFEKLSISALVNHVHSVYRQSDQSRLLRIAIALERFRRKNGIYPATLTELVPGFLESIPTGSIPGQTIQYVPLQNSGYKLWTFGWNGNDEGGTPGKRGGVSDDWALTKDPIKP